MRSPLFPMLTAYALFLPVVLSSCALRCCATAAPAPPDHALLLQLAAEVNTDHAEIAALKAQLAARPAAVAAASAHPLMSTTYGPFTVSGTSVTLKGYNLYIDNGTGETNSANGTGNLILGYDETGSGANTRTGSHNLILGTQNNYSSYGCLVGGLENNADGPDVAILGGRKNTASGHAAVIVGGEDNNTSGTYSVIGGKTDETTSTADIFLPESKDISNLQTQVTAATNTNSSQASAITSIQKTLAPFATSLVSEKASDGNTYAGYLVTITDANLQITNGTGSTNGEIRNPTDVSNPFTNGFGNVIIGYNNTQASLGNGATDTRTGSHNLILGDYNEYSAFGGMLGGSFDTLGGAYCGIVSGSYNRVGAADTAILGGEGNTAASNYYATISGGYSGHADGNASSISGGYSNYAEGDSSSVSGGVDNEASGERSSITGGNVNLASGVGATVSGGEDVTESNEVGWAGGAYESH